jgi:hypothetical protein
MKIFQKIRTRIAARKLPLDAAFWREVLELGAVLVRGADKEADGSRFSPVEVAEAGIALREIITAAKGQILSDYDAKQLSDAIEDIAGEVITSAAKE